MNTAEFWNREAESEGKTATEIFNSYYEELAQAERNCAEDLMNPNSALEMILEACCPDDDIQATEIVKVLKTDVKIRTRYQQTKVEAICKCTDGKNRVFIVENTYTSGSRYEPPDYDFDVKILDINS